MEEGKYEDEEVAEMSARLDEAKMDFDDEEGGPGGQEDEGNYEDEDEDEDDEEDEDERDHETALVESKSNAVDDDDALPSEVTDPKVMEFLKILDEYRLKCESEGNYAEAERASKQLDNLRKQEMKRQNKALKARQLSEKQSIQMAHNLQFSEFNAAWDKYMGEFDEMSAQYIQQMTARHAEELRQFQEDMHAKIAARPPKFSRELLEWRRREHMLARQKDYAQAQKIKAIADKMEAKERSKLDGEFQSSFAAKEGRFRAQQQAELNALLKRIEVRRKEHLSQRNLDSKRLLQRNRNVQAVLESKQTVEERIAKTEIKTRLTRPRNGVFGSPAAQAPTAAPKQKRAAKALRDKRADLDEPVPKAPSGLTESTFLTG